MADEVRTIVSLCGEWDLKFDPKNIGKERGWFARFPKPTARMAVPGVWEQIKPGYDGVGWYRTTFSAPKEWADKAVRVRFLAAAYYSEVWLNGEYLGDHEGGYSPFGFDISATMAVGENELVVRIINPPINEELEGFRAGAPLNQGTLPIGKGGWYFNFGGLWQEVEIVVTDKVYVDDCFVQPHPRRKKAVLSVTVVNKDRAHECELTCRVAPAAGGRAVAVKKLNVRLKKGVNTFDVPVTFSRVHLWSPDDPFLYTASVAAGCGGRVHDEHSVRFGMREFTIRGGAFYLNGKKIKMKGFLQQGMYPRTLCYPHSREFARRELKLMKDNGFNFIRAHLKPTNPWYLDMVDEMGFLVEGEPAVGWIGKSPHTERRIRSEVEGMLRRDRNHPSIVFWCLLNEAYHFRGFPMNEIKAMCARLAKMGRQLDPTRLLMDTSGGLGDRSDTGGAVIMLPYEGSAEMCDAHAYCPMPLRDESIVDYRTMGVPGIPLFISEYGAPLVSPDYEKVIAGYTEEERRIGLEDYALHRDFYRSLKARFRKAGLKKAFGNAIKLCAETDRVRGDEMRHIAAAQRANPKLGGAAFCQLADASGELFGATDVWREPKETFRQLAGVMGTPLLVPEILPRVQSPGATAAIRATLVNEDVLGPTYNWKVEVVKGRGRIVSALAGKVKATREVQVAVKEKVALELKPGKYALRATLLRGRRELSRQDMDFTVVADGKIGSPVVGTFDPDRVLNPYLSGLGIVTETHCNNYRNKNVPILLDMRVKLRRGLLWETFGELRKMVQLGGCGVLFEPQAMLFYEVLFPTLIRMGNVMRTIGYVKKHDIFAGLPTDVVAGYEYADVYPTQFDDGDDVAAAGGEVVMGGLSSHMWTRPADYTWGAGLYTVPIGRGKVVVCNMNVLANLGKSPVADRLFANLVNYAASQIIPGGEEKLFSRCIDPLKPEDYA